MPRTAKKIVIIGGGISGLSAAYYVGQLFRERDLPVEITVVEKSESLGGKIQTVHRDGFVIERGPDSFLSRKLPVIELSQALGLADEWVPTSPKANKTYILHKGRLHRFPSGFSLGIPTEWGPLLKTGLISPAGKMRAALDLLLPKRRQTSDESLGHFLERRLGREIVGHIAEPLLSGIYAGDAHSLSLRATFPQFQALEQEKRSLIRGMKESKKQTHRSARLPEMAQKSAFLSFRQGLDTLVNRLQEALQDGGVHIRTGQTVENIRKTGNTYTVSTKNETISQNSHQYRAHQNESKDYEADSLILATPAYVTSELLPDLLSVQTLAQIPYASVANVVLAFAEEDMHTDFDGSGFVVPRKEGRHITACTWTSSKWMHVAPEGKVLLRAYVGHAGNQEIVHLEDQKILNKVLAELRDLMGLKASPLFYEINRWNRAMPQYPVGHLENLALLDEELGRELPGVYLCGAGYRGVGIPDCIGQGHKAAEQVFSYLQEKS